jgi:cation transport ATPase
VSWSRLGQATSGTDVALDTAEVVLTSDDLEKLAYAVALGRHALRVVKQNLVLALGMIVVLIARSEGPGTRVGSHNPRATESL